MSTKIKLSDGCIVAVVDAINFAIKNIDEQQKYKMYLDLIDSPDKSGEISSIVNQKKIFQHEKELLHNAIMTVQNAGNDVKSLQDLSDDTYIGIIVATRDKLMGLSSFIKSLAESESTRGLVSTFELQERISMEIDTLKRHYAEFADAHLKFGMKPA